MELRELKGIGPQRLSSLRAVGICSLRDLLYTLPASYEDHITLFPCTVEEAGPVMVQGKIVSEPALARFHGLTRVTARLQDDSGSLLLCWFNQPWMKQQMTPDREVTLYGRLQTKNGRRSLLNPSVVTERGLIPVYRKIKDIPEKTFRTLISDALRFVEECCTETLPESIRLEYALQDLHTAIRQAHFPESEQAMREARRRLAFEQDLLFQCWIMMQGKAKEKGFPFCFPEQASDEWWHSLPFRPTPAQARVLGEIAEDLKKETAMSRLVQGDVGCGKTAVAFGAIFLAKKAGYQAAMMAPTEILAVQHFQSAREQLEPLGIRCRLLTGSTRAKERREVLAALEDGTCDAVFGTHALISDGVGYSRLGLVITDEQHRFGVRQRSRLREKGETGAAVPHVLVMSATPIPRTLALILYGDLDISVVDALPAGRIPVRTRLVPDGKRDDMYAFLKKEVASGRQAYVVCPLVDESEAMEDCPRSAKETFRELSEKNLSGLRLSLTWGEQKPEEKAEVLRAFQAGETDVLVSTTVIEVGVNVPNASVMIIENAERFGLSQLHQLRGRVGRGSTESWCFLVAPPSGKLRIMTQTNDGFEIARKDLELRGPGDLAGTRQSGESAMGIFPGSDIVTLEQANRCAKDLFRMPGKEAERLQVEKLSEEAFGGENGIRIARN